MQLNKVVIHQFIHTSFSRYILEVCYPYIFRSDSGLTAQQRFDMMGRADPSRGRHEFGQPFDAGNRSHPQVLPSSSQPSLPDNRRSRTPGPEHMRAPPDRSTDDR